MAHGLMSLIRGDPLNALCLISHKGRLSTENVAESMHDPCTSGFFYQQASTDYVDPATRNFFPELLKQKSSMNKHAFNNCVKRAMCMVLY